MKKGKLKKKKNEEIQKTEEKRADSLPGVSERKEKTEKESEERKTEERKKKGGNIKD